MSETNPVSPLRQRMIEDMTARKLDPHTQRSHPYSDVLVNGETLRDVAWSYPNPNPAFRSLRDHVAFYAGPFDGCFVDDERVTPQPGNFYGGWITSDISGPFKGAPGTQFW